MAIFYTVVKQGVGKVAPHDYPRYFQHSMTIKKFFFQIVFAIGCLSLSFANGWAEMDRVLYQGDSLYHHIQVSEADGYRYLSFNRARGNQSVVNIHDPYELKFAYTQAAFVAPAFLERPPGSMLILGLGGGSIPRVLAKHYPEVPIDIVEIDPDIVTVAQKFFFFEPTPNMNIISMDGRRFLKSSRKHYDFIFLDAYDDTSIPFHLTTSEFLEIVRKRLTPTGVVASNIWGPRTNEFYLSELKTFQHVFPHVYIIDCLSSQSFIFIAHTHDQVMTKPVLLERIPALQRQFQFGFELASYARTFEDMTAVPINAKLLLDDFAPVDILRARKALY